MKFSTIDMVKLIHGKKYKVKSVLAFVTALCFATLVFFMNTKVVSAEDYWVQFYSASNNPVSGSFYNSYVVSTSLDDAWESTLGKYGYIDLINLVRLSYRFSGFTTGYTYKYRPYSWIYYVLPNTPNLTGFRYDSIFVDHLEYRGVLTKIDFSSYDLWTNHCAYCFVFDFDWTEIAGEWIYIDVFYRVRLYASDASATSLFNIGEINLTPTISSYDNSHPTFVQTGAYIANFNMMSGSASQFNNTSLMAGYLYDIRQALSTSPDLDYETALDQAEAALDNEQSARDDVFNEVDQFYMAGADSLLTVDDLDSNVAVGLDFWFDWVNAYFNKGEDFDTNKPLTLNIIFNFISRLF